jgi:hypothetical protein
MRAEIIHQEKDASLLANMLIKRAEPFAHNITADPCFLVPVLDVSNRSGINLPKRARRLCCTNLP